MVHPLAAPRTEASLVRVTLTDGSSAHNVLAKLDGLEFVFACESAGHANALASAINQASWIERSA
jgi:hypothetical protein